MNESERFFLIRDIGLGLLVVLVMIFVGALMPWSRTSGTSPDFALISTAGGVITPKSHETMVLHFWMEKCGPCKRQIRSYASYQHRTDVPIYGVNIDGVDKRTLYRVTERVGMTYPSIVDPDRKLKRAFGVRATPTTVVIRDGQIIASETGGIGVKELAELLASR